MDVPDVVNPSTNMEVLTVEELMQKYLPAAMAEQEKAQFELELQRILRNSRQLSSKVTGSEENRSDISKGMMNFKASVRPVLTYASFLLLAYILLFGARINWVHLKDIPGQIWIIFITIFGFWFGGRAIQDAKKGKNG